MSPPVWLSATVAALVLLVMACMASLSAKDEDRSWIWQIGLLLFAPWPLAFFQLYSKTAALWTTGGLALAILLLVVAADMNIPNGSRLPKILGVITVPLSLLVLGLFKLFGLIAVPVFSVLRRFRR